MRRNIRLNKYLRSNWCKYSRELSSSSHLALDPADGTHGGGEDHEDEGDHDEGDHDDLEGEREAVLLVLCVALLQLQLLQVI